MKRFVFVVVLVLCFGVVSAHGVFWNMDGGELLSYEKFDRADSWNWDDDVGHVRDYDWRRGKGHGKRGCGERGRVERSWKSRELRTEKDYYYKQVSYSGKYEKIECYHSAPEGKLIYRKCPSSY